MSFDELTERGARAALRRSTWQGGVTKLSEMETVNEAFWEAMTPSERFLAVWELSREQYGSGPDAAGGPHGTPHGVRRR